MVVLLDNDIISLVGVVGLYVFVRSTHRPIASRYKDYTRNGSPWTILKNSSIFYVTAAVVLAPLLRIFRHLPTAIVVAGIMDAAAAAAAAITWLKLTSSHPFTVKWQHLLHYQWRNIQNGKGAKK